MCTLPPTLGSVVAALEPLGQATFGEGVVFEVSINAALFASS